MRRSIACLRLGWVKARVRVKLGGIRVTVRVRVKLGRVRVKLGGVRVWIGFGFYSEIEFGF